MRQSFDIVNEVLLTIMETLMSAVPGKIGRILRGSYYRRRLLHLGKNVAIDKGVRMINPQYISIGDNCWIDNYTILIAGPPSAGKRKIYKRTNSSYMHNEGEIFIGDNCHIANFVVLQGHAGVQIGQNTTVASGCKIYSMSHHHENLEDETDRTLYKFSSTAPESTQYLFASPVVMENNTALGLNSVVLPGVVIHEGSWVGALSLVSKSIPAFTIAVGNPAKAIKTRRL